MVKLLWHGLCRTKTSTIPLKHWDGDRVLRFITIIPARVCPFTIAVWAISQMDSSKADQHQQPWERFKLGRACTMHSLQRSRERRAVKGATLRHHARRRWRSVSWTAGTACRASALSWRHANDHRSKIRSLWVLPGRCEKVTVAPSGKKRHITGRGPN